MSPTTLQPVADNGVRLLYSHNYPRLPRSPRAARDHALGVAEDLTDAEALKLCVSELVTNSVLYAESGFITLVLWHYYHKGLLQCEVIDDGAMTAPRTLQTNENAVAGRGLFLVEHYALTWGTHYDVAGRTTWFTLATVKVTSSGEGGG